MNQQDVSHCLTREASIEGKRILVYDGLLPLDQIGMIEKALLQSPFSWSEIAKPEAEQYRHWARNLDLKATEQLPIYPAAMAALAPFCTAEQRYKMYRAYCNFSSYGDVLMIHTDCRPEHNELTGLWFMHEKWEVEWGGETLFYNSQDDAEFVCSPKPGRLVIFDGRIPHQGRPPTRICYAPRYTFAMKFEPVPASG